MNISKKLLVVGLLVTCMVQATNLTFEEKAIASTVYNDMLLQTQAKLVAINNVCKDLPNPGACLSSQRKLIFQEDIVIFKKIMKEYKQAWRQAAIEHKSASVEEKATTKEKKAIAQKAYEIERYAYDSYRTALDKDLI